MGELEYRKWKVELYALLTYTGFTAAEADAVCEWWDGIKASREVALVGEVTFDNLHDAMEKSYKQHGYNYRRSWTIKALFYAPYIVNQRNLTKH